MGTIATVSLNPRARITGVVYLLYFLTAILGVVALKGLVVSNDAAATAANLLAHESSFRLGLALGLISIACYIAVTALFYELFKPVNRTISLLAAFFSLVGCAILAFSTVFQLAPLVVLGGNRSFSSFNLDQLQDLALIFLKVNAEATNIALVFFAFYCLLVGYLIFKSAFLPRILGLLLVLAGFGWLSFLSPPLANHLSPFIQVLGFLAEASLMLWLLIKGVNLQRWNEQCAAYTRP